MKEKIFEKMKEYGWNLDNNTNEDFEKVYDVHYNFIDSLYDYFRENENNINLDDINEQQLHDFTDFISDFLRALNEIDK